MQIEYWVELKYNIVVQVRVEAELNRSTTSTTTPNNAKPSKVQTKVSKIPGPKSIIR